MSTHDYIIDNGTGAALRTDLNNALAAIRSSNSVSGNPGTPYAYQIFHDTAASQGLKQRDASNAASNGLLLYRPLVRDGIYDPANVSLEMIRFTGVASAVNELTVTNAVTGSSPILSATGGDANISLTLTPKGTGSVFVPAGTATNPSISVSSDTNTGIFFNAADQLSLVTGGTSRLVVTSTSVFVPAGTATNPSISVSTDTNTGIYFPAADTVDIATDGASRLSIKSDRVIIETVDVGIGSNLPLARLHVVDQTATTNAVTQVLRVESNSSGTPANGIGVGIEFAAHTGTSGQIKNSEIGATIEAIATDVTAASEDFDLSFKTMEGGAAAKEQVRITSTGLLQFNSGYGSVATAYGCRAWVNFNGTGTPAIRASGNVSSITDNGTGDYTVNFTTAMPDANYAVVLTGEHDQGTAVDFTVVDGDDAPTSSAVRVDVLRFTTPPSHRDSRFINVAIFR